jgi:predicted nucleic acid-binding protein
VPFYTVDTHALVWYFTNDSRLGTRARSIFHESIEAQTTLLIPTIVLAELLDIAEKKRVPVSFKIILRKIQKATNFAIVPLGIEIVKKAQSLTGIGELHDRLIAATALYFRSTLLTRDERLQRVKNLNVIW